MLGRSPRIGGARGPWYSKRICSWFCHATGHKPRSYGRTRAFAFEMAVLLGPELAIDRAALSENVVWRAVDDFALVEHEDLVALNQRRQAVRDDDHCASARDAL